MDQQQMTRRNFGQGVFAFIFAVLGADYLLGLGIVFDTKEGRGRGKRTKPSLLSQATEGLGNLIEEEARKLIDAGKQEVKDLYRPMAFLLSFFPRSFQLLHGFADIYKATDGIFSQAVVEVAADGYKIVNRALATLGLEVQALKATENMLWNYASQYAFMAKQAQEHLKYDNAQFQEFFSQLFVFFGNPPQSNQSSASVGERLGFTAHAEDGPTILSQDQQRFYKELGRILAYKELRIILDGLNGESGYLTQEGWGSKLASLQVLHGFAEIGANAAKITKEVIEKHPIVTEMMLSLLFGPSIVSNNTAVKTTKNRLTSFCTQLESTAGLLRDYNQFNTHYNNYTDEAYQHTLAQGASEFNLNGILSSPEAVRNATTTFRRGLNDPYRRVIKRSETTVLAGSPHYDFIPQEAKGFSWSGKADSKTGRAAGQLQDSLPPRDQPQPSGGNSNGHSIMPSAQDP